MKEINSVPLELRLRNADALAGLTLLLAAISATAGLLVPHLYRDSEAWVRQARAADLVSLFVVVPLLAVALWRAGTGSSAGRLLALAAVGYLIYNYAIFGFAVAINPMTPIHLAVLSVSVWSLVLSLIAMSKNPLRSDVGMSLPRRLTAIFLIAVAGLFAVMWLGQIAQSITSGRGPVELVKLGLVTNPVYTLDLAFALPFLALSGILLLRRSPVGNAVAVAALAWVGLMGLGVLAIFAFDGVAGAPVPVPVVVLIGAITSVGMALTAVALRKRGQEVASQPPAGPGHGAPTFGPPGRLHRRATRLR
jgi:hypothetical protein